MSYTDYLKENLITDEELSKEEVWNAAQRQLITDFITTLIPICLSNDGIDKIIEKINERA